MEWYLEESYKQCGMLKEHHQALRINLCGTDPSFSLICFSILYSRVPLAHFFGDDKA